MSALGQKRTFGLSLNRIFLCVLNADRFGAGLHLFRLVPTSSLPQEGGVVLKARGHLGMVWPQGFLPNRQGPFMEQFGMGIPALDAVELRQVVEVWR